MKDGELIELRRVGKAVPPPPSGPQLLLPWGDRIAVERGGALNLRDDRLHFRPALPDSSEWTIPLSSLAVFWRVPPEGNARPEKLRVELAGTTRSRDVLLLLNGDTIEGLLEAWDESGADKQLKIDVAGKKSVIAASKVAVVALTTEASSLELAKKPHFRLVLADGSRISVTGASSDSSTLSARTLFGADLRVPLDQVILLTAQQQRAVYLSDLKPDKVKNEPFLPGPGPTFRNDRTLDGDSLLLDGDCFDKGIAMRSGTSVVYALDGKYKRFQAVVGLDSLSGKLGNVRLRVLVDGKPQDEGRLGKEWTAKRQPVVVDFDITGARELTLVVEPGSSGPVQDHVDWCNARLLR